MFSNRSLFCLYFNAGSPWGHMMATSSSQGYKLGVMLNSCPRKGFNIYPDGVVLGCIAIPEPTTNDYANQDEVNWSLLKNDQPHKKLRVNNRGLSDLSNLWDYYPMVLFSERKTVTAGQQNTGAGYACQDLPITRYVWHPYHFPAWCSMQKREYRSSVRPDQWPQKVRSSKQ